MPKQGVVSIGLQVSYKESLDKMLNDFRATLKQVSNDAERIKWDSNMAKSFEAIQKRIDGVETDFKGMFDELNGQKLSTDKFEAYQKEISSSFEKIEADIKGLTGQFENLGNNDYVSKMVSQFKFLQENIKDTQRELGKVVDFTSSSSVIDLDIVKKVETYKQAIKEIQQIKDDAEVPDVDISNKTKIKEAVKIYKDAKRVFDELSQSQSNLLKEYNSSDGDDRVEIEKKLFVVRQQLTTQAETLVSLYDAIGKENLKANNINLNPSMLKTYTGEIDEYVRAGNSFIQQNAKMADTYKETQSQLDALVTEFKLKNGAIHIPIEIDKISDAHKNQLMGALNKLQAELDKRSVIAKVKLTLDDGSSKGRKKNSEFDQQQKDGQKKPAADLSPSIAKAYREGAKIAEESVKAGMAEIQKAFKDVPVTLKPDTDAFKADLKAMIDESFKAIAEDTTGLKVNEELEKLVTNLKEVSSSLSGNENFKFGLDEASIERITAAIRDMADMIQRAFGVASNDDIAAQWTAIESKFKGVAGEEGKLLKGNKEHKIAIQELAVEYKKYLDMGGKNDLSELTAHKQTVKNIATEYENLSKAAQEAAQKQEKVAKKPASKKVSSEEKEAVKGVTKQNKNLEEQAVKTGTALDNEGKKAQSAAEKFRKLAKEKGAAVVANRELAKAAKETADALEREAKVRKESKPKQNKDAVDGSVYNSNYLKWQRDIAKSLMDSGDYAEIYEAKITQAANGTVKFTAVVRDSVDRNLKNLSAKVNESGGISSPSVSLLKDNELAQFEKRLKTAEKVRNAIDAMDGGNENTFLNRTELEQGIAALIEAEEELDRFKVKKVSLQEGGKLLITTEVKEANGQIKEFVATFDSIGDIIDTEKGTIKEFEGELKSLGDVLEDKFNKGKFTLKMPNITEDESVGNIEDLYSEIYAIARKLSNLDVEIATTDPIKGVKRLQKLTAEYKELEDTYNSLLSAFYEHPDLEKNFSSLKEFFDLDEVLKSAKIRIDEINAALKETYKNDAKSILDKFKLKYEGNSNWSEVVNEVEKLKSSIAGIDSQDGLNRFKQNLSDIAAKLNNINKNNKLGKIFEGNNKTFKDIQEVRANIDSLFASMGKVNEKSIRVTGANKLTAEVKMANGEIRKMNVSLDSDNFARYVDSGIVQFGRLRSAAEGVFKGIKDMVRIYLSPQDFIRYFKTGFDKVKEIDTAMTELRKVSDAPTEDIDAYFDTAAASAKELGSSISEMIGATADWSRMGKSLPDSKELAEVAILYKNVGDNIDVEEATSSLVSTLQGFQMDAKDAIKIVDSFNEVANNYAINSDGIGESLKRSAAAFNAANTDLNKSIALIAATRLKIGWIYGNIY